MSKVIITGGSGFIGTNLVEHFIKKNDVVLNLDIRTPRNSAHYKYWQEQDLLDATGLNDVINNFSPDILFHLGSRTDLYGSSVSDYPENILGVENLIKAVDGSTSLKRIVFSSSRLVCKIGYEPKNMTDYCPTTAYGQSKVIGENLVHKFSSVIPCPWLIVRPTSIWGPWFDIPYKTFFLTISKGRYYHPRGKRTLKSFGFVYNTIYQLQKLIDADSSSISGETIYLADYPAINVMEMANAIQKELGVKSIRSLDVNLLKLAAILGDLFKLLGWKNPPISSFRLDNLLTDMRYDLNLLERVSGPLPFSMVEGVKITIEWLKKEAILLE
tara:strand:- start:27697 stop:28680 length:984 start_codon:yes stop_codon:yes gene_type:complete